MPVGEVPRWHLDWLSLGGRGVIDQSNVQWILMDQTGFWDSPDVRLDVTDRSNSHGSYVGPIHYKERVITLKGRAFCEDATTLRQYWTLITGLCADPNASYRLACDSEIGTLECSVRRDGAVLTTPNPTLNTNSFDFSVQLIAPDPRKYSSQWRTMRAALPSATTGDGLLFDEGSAPNKGLNFNAPDMLTFGMQNASGLLQLVNAGTAPTAPIYELYGPLSTPTLTATPTGATQAFQMTYNGVLGDGEVVRIDPSMPSVLLGGTASRRWLLNPAEFNGFYVPAGDPFTGQSGTLNVGISHQGASDTGGYATVTFADAYF